MKKIGVFYGSTTGTTAAVAERIARKIGIDSVGVFDVGNTSVDKVMLYEVLLLGSSTWGIGDLQDDWKKFLPKLKQMDLGGKYVSIFGTGDAISYGNSFCNAIGLIYSALRDTNCLFCGAVSTDGYTFNKSIAEISGMFVGLPLDEVNEADLTDQRLDQWLEQTKAECFSRRSSRYF